MMRGKHRTQDWGRDVIRKITCHNTLIRNSLIHKIGQTALQEVPANDLKIVWVPASFPQSISQFRVDFDSDDASCRAKQVPRERAAARPDFDHRVSGTDSGLGDSLESRFVPKEVLTELGSDRHSPSLPALPVPKRGELTALDLSFGLGPDAPERAREGIGIGSD